MGDQLHAPIGFMYESLQPLTQSVFMNNSEPEKYKILFLENLPKTVRAD